MALIVYERLGYQGRRPSPFSWRARFAAAHKQVEVQYRAVRFADAPAIRKISGQSMVPVLVDGDRVVHDSWSISLYLEQRFPERPSLFGSAAAIGAARFVNCWCDATLNSAIRRLIYADFLWCLDEDDRTYFRSSRERDLGCTLEQACADRPAWVAAFNAAIVPLERLLAGQAYLGGNIPNYCDYIVFSAFQWARLGSPTDILSAESVVRRWRGRMIALFDGLADRFPGYPSERRGSDGKSVDEST